jgi:hypothetical protein
MTPKAEEHMRKIESLRRLDELLSSEGWQHEILPILHAHMQKAESRLLDREVTGPQLEIARAEYLLCRSILNEPTEKQTNLRRHITQAQNANPSLAGKLNFATPPKNVESNA